jgi:hypothetical protein
MVQPASVPKPAAKPAASNTKANDSLDAGAFSALKTLVIFSLLMVVVPSTCYLLSAHSYLDSE